MARHTYWTIIVEGGPTSFRARDRESLLPTLKQLQSRHPDSIMKWFANGRLWDSPEHAREYARLARLAHLKTRGRDWRPGGDHRDPRARFKKGGNRRRPEGGQGKPSARRSADSPQRSQDGTTRKEDLRKAPSRNGRQRRPYRPTGGTRRGGGKGRS